MNQRNEWSHHYDKAMDEIVECDFNAAEEHLKAALSVVEADTASSEMLEYTLAALAQVHRFQDNYDSAEKSFNQLLGLQKETYGVDSLEVGMVLKEMGDTFFEKGNFVSAEMFLQQALKIFDQKLSPVMYTLADTIDTISVCCRMLGRQEEALNYAERSIALIEGISGPNTSGLAQPLDNYEFILRALGQFSKADEVHARSESIRKKYR